MEHLNTSTVNEKIAARFVEEGGVNIILTLLLNGAGNLATNPRPGRMLIWLFFDQISRMYLKLFVDWFGQNI